MLPSSGHNSYLQAKQSQLLLTTRWQQMTVNLRKLGQTSHRPLIITVTVSNNCRKTILNFHPCWPFFFFTCTGIKQNLCFAIMESFNFNFRHECCRCKKAPVTPVRCISVVPLPNSPHYVTSSPPSVECGKGGERMFMQSKSLSLKLEGYQRGEDR